MISCIAADAVEATVTLRRANYLSRIYVVLYYWGPQAVLRQPLDSVDHKVTSPFKV